MSFLYRITDIKVVSINVCQSYIKICSILYPSIKNQKAKGDCKSFNTQKVFLAKYPYSNIDDVTM